MRKQTVLALVGAGIIVAIICVATPQLSVTLNEAGTEVLGMSLLKPAQPALAEPRE